MTQLCVQLNMGQSIKTAMINVQLLIEQNMAAMCSNQFGN